MAPRRALVVGRFQPFHLGHLQAVRRVAAEVEEVVVAIGSADASHTLDNPFTAGERLEMVTAALREAGVANALVVPVPDLNRNPLWVAHVRSLVPRFQVVFTNNALPAQLFREAGHEVRPLPFVERERLEGRRIRRLMLEKGEWRALVPPPVARIVDEVEGEARLVALARDDAARR